MADTSTTRTWILLAALFNVAAIALGFSLVRSEHVALEHQVQKLSNALASRDEAPAPGCEAAPGDVVRVLGIGLIELDNPTEYVQRQLVCNRRYEPEVLDTIEALVPQGSTVIDAGAFLGTHSLVLARTVGPGGRVLAFEPVARLAARIRRSARRNGYANIEVYEQALGAESTTGVMSNPGRAGGRACTDAEVAAKVAGCTKNLDLDNAFEMVRIDDLTLDDLSLIKIDVEGHEMSVLAGARDVIAREKPLIIIEVWEDERRGELGNTREDVLGTIREMGYDVSPIDHHNFLATPRS